MHQITGAILTFNEEKHIEACIQSIQGICDEIIVLDSYSTDHTVAIAKKMGAIVYQEKWAGFVASKNRLNHLACYEYVLNIDADERVSEELKKSILSLKKNNSQGVFELQRLNNYCGKWIQHGEWYPDKKIRLFPKNTQWKGGKVHEYIEAEGDITTLKGHLLHFGFDHIADHKKRSKKYAKLAAEQHQEKSIFSLFLKMIFSPPFRFLKAYFLKQGFRDGFAGFKIAQITTKEVFLKYFWALKSKK